MRLTGIFLAVLMLATGSVTESGAGGPAAGASPEKEALSGFFLPFESTIEFLSGR